MARFRGTIEGRSKTTASRLGSNYLITEANGWNVGVRVELHPDGDTDKVVITLTGGSNRSFNDILLCDVDKKGIRSDLLKNPNIEDLI